jgi:putative endonuclease
MSGFSQKELDNNNWFIYILRCVDNSLYIGISKNVEERIKKHNVGKGSKYVNSRKPSFLVYVEGPFDHSAALKKELFLKSLKKHQKELLINERK